MDFSALMTVAEGYQTAHGYALGAAILALVGSLILAVIVGNRTRRPEAGVMAATILFIGAVTSGVYAATYLVEKPEIYISLNEILPAISETTNDTTNSV